MYKIPKDLNISKVNGNSTTHICVGPFDLQFYIGDVHFNVSSAIRITKDGEEVTFWEVGRWPGSVFYDLLNVDVESSSIPNDREIEIKFNNGYVMHIYDSSDNYESFIINIKGENKTWVI